MPFFADSQAVVRSPYFFAPFKIRITILTCDEIVINSFEFQILKKKIFRKDIIMMKKGMVLIVFLAYEFKRFEIGGASNEARI
jgi:hypothetical protein